MPEDEDYDTDDPLMTDHGHGREERQGQHPPLRSGAPRHCLALGLGIILSLVLVIALALVSSRILEPNKQCTCQASHHSPIDKAIGNAYSTVNFNGSFMRMTQYRFPGSHKVDEAWEDLGIEYRPSIILEPEAMAAGLTRQHVQRGKIYGGGYFVQVEGLHHLHCLNLLRKSLYFNHQYYRTSADEASAVDEELLRYHITHCLDILRQVLMCNVDTGLLGQVWTLQPGAKVPEAFPDFNTQHECRDYEAVRRWAKEHQMPFNADAAPGYVAAPEAGDVLPFIP